MRTLRESGGSSSMFVEFLKIVLVLSDLVILSAPDSPLSKPMFTFSHPRICRIYGFSGGEGVIVIPLH